MRTVLRSAAIIISLIWLFYLLNGWIEYSNLVSYNIPDPFGIKEKAVQKAFNSLIFQTPVALILLLCGIFMSGSPSENGELVEAGTSPRPIDYSGSKDLSNSAYQIYLTKKFNIEKNSTLNKFIVQDSLFDTLEDALNFASNLHENDLASGIQELPNNIRTQGENAEIILKNNGYILQKREISHGIIRWQFKHLQSGNITEFKSLAELEKFSRMYRA